MKTILRCGVLPIFLVVLGLSGAGFIPVVFGQAGGSNDGGYVTIKLKDGALREGTVLAEDDQKIIIDAQFANGTITRKDTIQKVNIAVIVRLNESERTQRLATMAYHNLGQYQLDPQNTYPLSYYDKVMNEVFKHFLKQYPNTAEANLLINRIAEWQAERDKVASGQAKRHGQWMAATEAEKLAQTERMQQVLQETQALVTRGQFKLASDKLAPYYKTSQPPELATESQRLQTEIYRLWISSLETQQQQLNKDIQVAQERVTRASDARSRAQNSYNQARANATQNPNKWVLGKTAAFSQASALTGAQKELADAQSSLSQLQQELDFTVSTLTNVRPNADAFAAAFPGIQLAKETSPKTPSSQPPPPPPSQSLLSQQMSEWGDWFSKNWVWAVAGVVLALWGVSRLFTRS